MKPILILIPAFNEQGSLAETVDLIREALPGEDILVVDDGSTDRTSQIASEKGCSVVRHPWNMGYGTALQTGYKYARNRQYRFVVQLDGDGQHDPASICSLLQPLLDDQADFVIGSRFHHTSDYHPPLLRSLVMALFSGLVRLLVRKPFTDTTSGFQAFNAEVVNYFSGDHFPCDYPDADLLISLHRAGFRMMEVPVKMYVDESGESMHSGLKPLYYLFKMFLSIGVTLMRSQKRG